MKHISMTYDSKYPYIITAGHSLGWDVRVLGLPDFEAFTLRGIKIAACVAGQLRIYSPYAWNGTTGLPAWMETEETLEASCMHDLLYQLSSSTNFYLEAQVPRFTREAVDALFLRHVPWYYRGIFRAALCLFGDAYWGQWNQTLTIKLIKKT